ncbi:methyltransferase domain-containing protein [Candidatus Uhrbacteria bacterium]|nr:methyltransferase domain-containing protein [Candidatus Uhrbacteria bacterium]
MEIDRRLKNEVAHGKYILEKGEQIWNWSSAAGKLRWARRCELFRGVLGGDGKKILEIGCGTGLFTLEIAKTGNEIIAIDISNDLLGVARKRVYGDNVEFRIENAYQTSFIDGFFDFIVGSSVLHHLDVDRAIREFYRLIKPGGEIIFTEPNMLNPQIAIQKNIPFIKKMVGDSPDETAFIRWNLASKLAKAGFSEVEIVPFDFLHPAIPGFCVNMADLLLRSLERLPVLREISGSLIIRASKKI